MNARLTLGVGVVNWGSQPRTLALRPGSGHVFDEFRWRNFKPFVDTGWIAVKPITILIGSNNSGKSSVLAPLLLMKQTLRSGRAGSPLVLRDELINAGSFSDIVHNHDLRKHVTFSFRFRDHHSEGDEPPELGEDAPAECSMTFRAGRSAGTIDLYKYSVADSYSRALLERTLRPTRRYTLTRLNEWGDRFDEGDENEGERDSQAEQAARAAIENARPFHFLLQSRSVTRAALKL
jgi:hypothetical protein